MPLSVTCPRCESKYQLDASMRGKKMRCPNPICRAVIEVRDDNDPPAPPPVQAKAPPPSESAPPQEEPKKEPLKRKLVPKPVEPQPSADFPDDFPGDDEPAPAPPAEPASPSPPVPLSGWEGGTATSLPGGERKSAQPPPKPEPQKPVVKREPAVVPATGATGVPNFPDDFPSDDEPAATPGDTAVATEAWQPDEPDEPPIREGPVSAPAGYDAFAPTPPPVKRRRVAWAIAAMVLVLAVLGAAGYWRLRTGMAVSEADRFEKADTLFKELQFAEASAAFQKLSREFPDSPHAKKYRFLAELSDVGQAVYRRETADETDKALARAVQLTTMYKGDPLLKERAADIGPMFDFLATRLTEAAEEAKSPALLLRAKAAWLETKKFPLLTGKSLAERERKLEADWTRIDSVLTTHIERERVVSGLKKLFENVNAATMQEAFTLVEQSKHRADAEVRSLLDDLVKAHREHVKYVAASTESRAAPIVDDALPSLSVTLSTVASEPVRTDQARDPVLALARGVLYALEPADGAVRWVRRLGIDTHVLPIRIPADAITPDLLLTLSSDQRSLSALIAATGDVLWQTALSEVCLGQPVVVDRRVLVPTIGGRIDEIEIAEGRVLGAYHLGQPLTLGGVRAPGTTLAYFPGDDFCLYTLDVSKRTCVNILYTRHPAGSLRGLPVMMPSEKDGVLLWSQTKGQRVELKPYALPIVQPEQKPIEPIVDLPELSAPPWPQADRLAVVTNRGMLSVWGYRQPGTSDRLLFRMLKDEFSIEPGAVSGRCQIVHADADTYWTLTRGRLQRVEKTFDAKLGPGLLTRWTQPVVLGALLHPADARRTTDGRTILYVTTQADDHATCLCTAIDADANTGKILWQRQLGVLPLQTPRVLGEQIVVRDALGLVRFDSAKLVGKNEPGWRSAGDWLAQSPWRDGYSMMLIRETTLAQLSGPRGGKKLHVRVIVGADKPRDLDIVLPASLQGTPALGDGFLLLPLADGLVHRASLVDGSLTTGPDWRAVGAEEQARGHVVILDAANGIRTDGSTGIARLAMQDGKLGKTHAERKLAHRITKAPVIMPIANTDKVHICVADASDTLTLLDPERLEVVQAWPMPGKITAGPFVRAGKVGCVIGRNHLVWLDPLKKEPAWQYRFDADIVSQPNLIDGVLVVADVAGQFAALDPASGGRLGAGITLRANVAATAAPLPFGPGQAFVPLTDGTIVVLPLAKLR